MILYALLAKEGISVGKENFATLHIDAPRIYGDNGSNLEGQLALTGSNASESFLKMQWKDHRCREIIKGRVDNEILPAAKFASRAKSLNISSDTHFIYGAMITFGSSTPVNSLSYENRDKLFAVLCCGINNGNAVRKDISVTLNGRLINVVIRADSFGGRRDVGMLSSLIISIVRDGSSALLSRIISLYDEHDVEDYFTIGDRYSANKRRNFRSELAKLFVTYSVENNNSDYMWQAMCIYSYFSDGSAMDSSGPISAARSLSPYKMLHFLKMFSPSISEFFSVDRARYGYLYKMWQLGKLLKEF